MKYDQNSVNKLVKALNDADKYINEELRLGRGPVNLVAQCSWLAPAAAELKEYAESRAADNYQAFIQRASVALSIHKEKRSAENWRDFALGQAIIDLAFKRLSVALLEKLKKQAQLRTEMISFCDQNRNISRYDIHVQVENASRLEEEIGKLADYFDEIHNWASETDFSLFDEFADKYQLYVNLRVDPEEILRFPDGAFGNV